MEVPKKAKTDQVQIIAQLIDKVVSNMAAIVLCFLPCSRTWFLHGKKRKYYKKPKKGQKETRRQKWYGVSCYIDVSR